MDKTPDFTKLVPGFDFLQGLVKNAGSTMPSIGQWVAPTLNAEELDKRIAELRAVQFWLEQNVRMLSATIQALEVQRMTLSTLKTMNVQMDDLRDAMLLRVPGGADSRAPAPPVAAPNRPPRKATTRAPKPEPAGATAAPGGVVDPMQWWSALTKQFTELASSAMKDTAADAARNLAGATGSPSSIAAAQTPKRSGAMPAQGARKAAAAAKRRHDAS